MLLPVGDCARDPVDGVVFGKRRRLIRGDDLGESRPAVACCLLPPAWRDELYRVDGLMPDGGAAACTRFALITEHLSLSPFVVFLNFQKSVDGTVCVDLTLEATDAVDL